MKDFTYIYRFDEEEYVKLNRKQRKYIDLNTDDCYEIYLSMRPWHKDRLIDTPKRLTGIFWNLKKETELLTLRQVKGRIFTKKIEDKSITCAEELEKEIVKRDGTDFALIYELGGKPSKFVDFSDSRLVECYFHRSLSNEVKTVFQRFAEKIAGSNEAEAKKMCQFMQERVQEGMKLPELVTIFEEMAKIPLHCMEEFLRIDIGVYDFSGEDRLHFDLTRMIPTGHDDEFFLICMSIMYPVIDIAYDVSEDVHCDCQPLEDFFAELREYDTYKQICEEDLTPIEVRITVEET